MIQYGDIFSQSIREKIDFSGRIFTYDSYVKFAYEVKFFFYTFAYFFRHRYKKSQSLGSLGSLFFGVIAIFLQGGGIQE